MKYALLVNHGSIVGGRNYRTRNYTLDEPLVISRLMYLFRNCFVLISTPVPLQAFQVQVSGILSQVLSDSDQ